MSVVVSDVDLFDAVDFDWKVIQSINKLEVHGRARREADRRHNSEWTVNLGIPNSSRNNTTCRMTLKTVS